MIGIKILGVYVIVPFVSASMSSIVFTARRFVAVGTAKAAPSGVSNSVSMSGVIGVDESISTPWINPNLMLLL